MVAACGLGSDGSAVLLGSAERLHARNTSESVWEDCLIC